MIFFLVFIFFLYVVIFFEFKSNINENTISELDELKFSIIVAAKNEEKNISALIKHLANQNFRKENYEVIIIDDNSIDSTFEKTKIEINDLINFTIVKAENKKYEGKRGALQIGIEKSKFSYILITDADCEPSKNWIKSFSNKFNQEFDFVIGKAPLIQTESLINKISCFDNLWTHILTFSFANIGFPYSASARSFGFKKDSFFKIEGYKNTTKTLSGDDDLLLQEAIKYKMKIGINTENDSEVFSNTKKTSLDFIKQKSRHTSSSNYYSVKFKIILGVWHLLNLLFLFSPLFYWINSNFIYLFLIKIVTDIFIVSSFKKDFSYKFNVIEILYLQIFYEIFIILNFIVSFFRKGKW
ncbi:MAG: glycosyltransferase [Ignavibacteriae bacterium]|nr:glycosyltransferase [Ignavibacteriota bacterium]